MRKLRSQIQLHKVIPSVNDEVGFDVRVFPLCHSPCSVLMHHLRGENPKSDYHSRPLPWSPNPYTHFLYRNLYLDIGRNFKGNTLPHEAAPPVIPFMVRGGSSSLPGSASPSPDCRETAQTSKHFSPSLCCPLAQGLVISCPECHTLPILSAIRICAF